MIRLLFGECICFCDNKVSSSVASINIVYVLYECASFAVDGSQGTGPLELLYRVSNLPRLMTVAHVLLLCINIAMIWSSIQ
jgi:hypothetical protein